MSKTKSTTAQTALDAHLEIETKGFTEKQNKAWTKKLETLQKASDLEIENNAKLDSETKETTSDVVIKNETGDTLKVETKVETSKAETKEAPKEPEIKLVITSGIYGRDGKQIEITDILNKLPNGGNNRKLTNKLTGNDPYPKKIKFLDIVYLVNGIERKSQTMENEKIELDLSIPVVPTKNELPTETVTATSEETKEETTVPVTETKEEILEEVTA